MAEECYDYQLLNDRWKKIYKELDNKYPRHCCDRFWCCKGEECGVDCCVDVEDNVCNCAKPVPAWNEEDRHKCDEAFQELKRHPLTCEICEEQNND